MGRAAGKAAERYLAAIEQATGTRPTGCPWRAFEEPIVGDAIVAHRNWDDLRIVLGDHPPAIAVQAVSHYHAALESAQVERMKRESKKPNG